ncbi:hypothetical protein [Pseudomonas putida]|uniref:Uncharacterized protein n=1 Tax=Pseudomonas putida TaxID=303 RepID=A0A8I1JIM4_PSEPU|nr:hypothetical protein [Pseudomonas putida]MBI6885157.1 hypothetical protein [Pseudomonas putida]
MKKVQTLQVISSSAPYDVLFQETNPVSVAKWLVETGRYPVIQQGVDTEFKVVGGSSVYLAAPGLINLFVETFVPEIVDSKKGLAESKAGSEGLLESGVTFEYIWKFLGEEEANARLQFNEFFSTDRRSHKLIHLKDFHVGELVYWEFSNFGADRVAANRKVRPFGRVVTKEMRPEINGRLAIQTIDEPSWLLDIQAYLEKGVTFYSTTDVHQVEPKTAEHERLLIKHQSGTATFEEMQRLQQIEAEGSSLWWLTKASLLGVAFVYGLVHFFA